MHPLSHQLFTKYFRKNSPEIACQVPKPPKSNKQKKIEFEIELGPIRYTGYRSKTTKPQRICRGFVR
jgi:hypothetical protein